MGYGFEFQDLDSGKSSFLNLGPKSALKRLIVVVVSFGGSHSGSKIQDSRSRVAGIL